MTDTSKELPELLPCPFCGGDAGDTYYQLGWFISCKHCSASTEVTNAKARAVEAWNRRAPAVPQFSCVAQKKLDYLLEAGEAITGYAIENKDGRHGAINCHGFVYWWQDAAAPQTPEAQGSVSNATLAAPVQMPEPWGHCVCGNVFVSRNLPAHIKPMVDSGEFKDIKLYTEQQVRQLLAAHGIQEQIT